MGSIVLLLPFLSLSVLSKERIRKQLVTTDSNGNMLILDQQNLRTARTPARSTVAARSQNWCGTVDLSVETRHEIELVLHPYKKIKAEQLDRQRLQLDKSAGETRRKLQSDVTVQVVFHVLTKSDGEGQVPIEQLLAQLQVLNEDLSTTGFSFQLQSADTVQYDAWATMASSSTEEQQAKEFLRNGGAGTLNVYTIVRTESNLLGWATFPNNYASQPSNDGTICLLYHLSLLYHQFNSVLCY